VIRDQFLQKRHYLGAATAVAVVYVIFIGLISPQREFPLNDDWAYYQMLQHLLKTGDFRSRSGRRLRWCFKRTWLAAWPL